jgi:heme-degrading monooxygenase HmoA
MLTIVWEFHVRPEARAEFEREYGPDGAWAALFRRAAGYRGTELLADAAEPLRYLTLDRWDGPADFERFRAVHAAEYAALDAACARLTADERCLGSFSA